MPRMPGFLPRFVWEHTVEVPEDTNAMAGQINGRVSPGRGELHWKRGLLWQRRVLRWPMRWRLAESRGWDNVAGTWREGNPITDYDPREG